MGRACVVPRCKTGYRSVKEKRSVFKVPKNADQFKKWQAAMPGIVLKQSQVVCEKHFEPKCILREWVKHDSAGRIIAQVTYLQPRLVASAVPTIFDHITKPELPDSDNATDEEKLKFVKCETFQQPPKVTLNKTSAPAVLDKLRDRVSDGSNSLEDQCKSAKCESIEESPRVTIDKTSEPPVSDKPMDDESDGSNSLEDNCKSAKCEGVEESPMVTQDAECADTLCTLSCAPQETIKRKVPPVTPGPKRKVTLVTPGPKRKVSPVTPVLKQKVAPVTTVLKQKVSPVTPVLKQKVSPVTTVLKQKVSPVTPVLKQKVAPETPVLKQKVAPETPVLKQKVDPETPVLKQKVAPETPVPKQKVTPETPVLKQKVTPETPVPKQKVPPVTPIPSAASASPKKKVVDSASNLQKTNFVLSMITINDYTSDEEASEKNPITIPKSWGVTEYTEDTGQRVVFSSILRTNTNGIASTIINKSVEIGVDKTLRYCVYGRLIDPEKWQLPPVLTDTTQLPRTLQRFRGMNVCQGLGPVNVHHLPIESVFQDSIQRWRDKNCPLLAKQKRCEHCKRMRLRNLQRESRFNKAKNVHRISNLSNPVDRWKLIALREKISRERRNNNYLKRRVQSLTESLEEKAKEISSVRAGALDDKLAELKVPPSQQTAIKEIISAATRREAKSRRYSEDWLMLCFMMHLRSPSCYEFLRENDVLPLPCARTIRSYFTLISVE